MIRKKIFVLIGSVVLATSAFFVVNANRKYLRATSVYFRTTPISPFLTLFKDISFSFGSSAMNLTTTQIDTHTAFFRTFNMSGFNAKTLFATKSTRHRLYFK